MITKKSKNHHERFHQALFRFYFTEANDIGSIDVIKSVATESGLDTDDLVNALKDGRYRSRLAEARKEGVKDVL